MRRHAIGAISLIGLFIAGFAFVTQGYDKGLNNFFSAMSLRLGITMGAIWLGLPDLDRLFEKYPPWVFLLGIVIVLMVVANRNFFPIVITLVVLAVGIQFVSRMAQPNSRSNGRGQSAKEKTKD